MIDLHCHVLAGIDDGPATIEESLALARAAAAAGTRTLVATPHVSRRYPNDAETIAELVEALNRRLSSDGVDLEIRRGGEIAMTRVLGLASAQLAPLRLGDGPWLLVEPSFTEDVRVLEKILRDLQDGGYRVVLAHPERCTAFHRDPLMLESLVQNGALCSVTAGALVGRFGEHVRRFALRLAHDGLMHNVASDAHDLTRRPPGMAREIEQAGLGQLASWLTGAVPEAILRGEEVPPRPLDAAIGRPHVGRRWWRRGSQHAD